MVINASSPTRIPATPARSSSLWQPPVSGDHFSPHSGHGSKGLYSALGVAGAAAGGYAVHHLAASLTGTASAVAGGVGGALALGVTGALVGGVIAGASKPGFEGLAAAYGGAVIGGGVGVIGGAIAGARLGSGNLLVSGAGAIAGAAVGLVFAKGLAS